MTQDDPSPAISRRGGGVGSRARAASDGALGTGGRAIVPRTGDTGRGPLRHAPLAGRTLLSRASSACVRIPLVSLVSLVPVVSVAALTLPSPVAAQCVPTVTVTTTAELRAAAADVCVSTVLLTPGTYDLTADGLGALDPAQDKVFRNLGGGEAILDAAGASRTVQVGAGIVVEIDGLTITGGAGGNGAGIRTRGDLVVRNSTITGNSSNTGAGLFHFGGTVLLENVTVSGNTSSRDGGGLDLRDGARLVHVTVANNAAGSGGGLRSRSAAVTLANTLVADNAGAGQILGAITSLGGNLVEGGCAGCGAGDLTGDPSLLPLAWYGGDTWTHGLGPGSIALDAAAVAYGLGTDQRGFARPYGLGYDIGAFEDQPVFAVAVTAGVAVVNRLPSNGTAYAETFTVTNTGPSAASYVLLAASTGSAVVVDSVRGAGLTYGARPDSALTGLLAGGVGSVLVDVFYTVTDVAAGTADPVTLTAEAVAAPSVTASDLTTVTVVRPLLGMTKLASVAGDPIPGAAITYQMTVTNLGTEAAALVEVVDTLPATLEYQVGSAVSSLPTGIAATLEFDDGSGSWSYAPVSGGCGGTAGFDRCVVAVRWTLDAPLPAVAPDNAADFSFITGIR